MRLLPFTTILLVFAVTISVVEDSVVYGLLPFALAFLWEFLRFMALRDSTTQEPTQL